MSNKCKICEKETNYYLIINEVDENGNRKQITLCEECFNKSKLIHPAPETIQ